MIAEVGDGSSWLGYGGKMLDGPTQTLGVVLLVVSVYISKLWLCTLSC